MKVEKIKKEFEPVVITLENSCEFKIILALLIEASLNENYSNEAKNLCKEASKELNNIKYFR
jgi:hypothetical protein